MTADQIRESYLKFFESKDHMRLPSFSLVPVGDPTLLIINAGMAPLKPYFKGEATPPHPRITTVQKCIRVGDIEQVGRTARHMTFFEMLGNFSFGDYYKKMSIIWAWEYFTEVLGLPAQDLYVTIHPDDDEAEEIWIKEVGIPREKIYRDENNFWGPVGDTGPCGPCSELLIDQGPAFGCGKPDCKPGCDCDRYLELWNLVFTGLYKNEKGEFENLPSQCIDTGMGFERLVAYLHKKKSVFETELFEGIIGKIQDISEKKLGENPKTDIAIKVIADHIRSVVFMIADGISPSNEGRGYVMRRLVRRAIRFGREIGFKDVSLTLLIEPIVEMFGHIYPELVDRRQYILSILLREEENFRRTLSQGLTLLENLLDKVESERRNRITGKEVFSLYDTYGLPLELTLELAEEKGFTVDLDAFNKLLEEQRTRARADLKTKLDAIPEDLAVADDVASSEFIGYQTDAKGRYVLENEGRVLAISVEKENCDAMAEGATGYVIFDYTCFYGESGGQLGDTGQLRSDTVSGTILDTRKTPADIHIHKIRIDRGILKKGDKVKISVDGPRRWHIMRHHTSTHLLQAALRKVVGSHVGQMGSLVSPDYFRFDFSHHGALTPGEINGIEEMVNQWIVENISVHKVTRSLSEALEEGALAFFGEKYGDQVRLVSIAGVSAELCGGTHVFRTGDIGCFKIVSESAIGMGVRRVEGVCGMKAVERFQMENGILKTAAGYLNTDLGSVPDAIVRIRENQKHLEKELKTLKEKLLSASVDSHRAAAVDVDGISLIVRDAGDLDRNQLRILIDQIADPMKRAVVAAGSVSDGKTAVLVRITDDLAGEGLSASEVIKEISLVLEGSGGGRERFAQAGGRDPEKLKPALNSVKDIIKNQIGKMRIKN